MCKQSSIDRNLVASAVIIVLSCFVTPVAIAQSTFNSDAANAYSGVTNVTQGTFQLAKTDGITAIAGNANVGNGTAGAILALVNGNQIADTSIITLQGAAGANAILRLNNNNETIAVLNSNTGNTFVESNGNTGATAILSVSSSSQDSAFSGVMRNNANSNSSTLGLVKNGSSTLTLTGSNTYTGSTSISGGTLQLGNGGTTGSLSSTTTIVNSGTLALNRSNTVTQGTDFSNSGISGTGALSKLGAGTLVLNMANTYSGGTTVSAGTLAVNNTTGSGTGTGVVTVNAGGTIVGTGSFDGGLTLAQGGTLAPGNSSIGTLSLFSGTANINGTLSIDVDGLSGTSDLFDATGSLLTLGNNSILQLNTSSFLDDQAYVLVKYNSLSGTFGTITGLQAGYGVDYAYQGNSIAVLSIAAVPEPPSFFMMSVFCGLAYPAYRRFRKKAPESISNSNLD